MPKLPKFLRCTFKPLGREESAGENTKVFLKQRELQPSLERKTFVYWKQTLMATALMQNQKPKYEHGDGYEYLSNQVLIGEII